MVSEDASEDARDLGRTAKERLSIRYTENPYE